ncbi:MAG: hypothetical protein HDR88_03830 [Bacteroides sp.]|nr:hypothetical protein [Bacteroides sp.]
MKNLKSLLLMALCAASLQSAAQSVTIKFKDGGALQYDASKIEYIQYSDENIGEFNILTEQYVPDYTFREWLNNKLADGSGVFTNVQAEEYRGELNLANEKTIRSLKGLEFFTNLTSLVLENCSGIDSSTLPALEHLIYFNCSYTAMETFDIMELYPALESVNFAGCKFAGDITLSSPVIKKISCSQNTQMSGLDVSGCTNLEELVCSFCGLITLNLGDAPITSLYCHQNPYLGQVDFNHVRATLRELNVSATGLTELDLSGCVALEELECEQNSFTTTPDFNGCTKLTRLRCENTGISSLDVSSLINLQELHCYQNNLKELDLSGLSKLEMVNAFSNHLESINVEGCESIWLLSLYSNNLERIDLTGCSQNSLTDFGCEDNPVTQIKVWSTFDIANPPSRWYKPETAEYVYEFTDSPIPDDPVTPDKEYVMVNFNVTQGYEAFISQVCVGTDMTPVENWKDGVSIEKGDMLVVYGDNSKYICTEFQINGVEESWWGYWYGNIEEDTLLTFTVVDRPQYDFTVEVDNADAVTLYLDSKPVQLTDGINNLKYYESFDYLYVEQNDGWEITSVTYNGEELGGSGTFYFPPLSENASITITTVQK